MAFRSQKFSGLSRNGPLGWFEMQIWAQGRKHLVLSSARRPSVSKKTDAHSERIFGSSVAINKILHRIELTHMHLSAAIPGGGGGWPWGTPQASQDICVKTFTNSPYPKARLFNKSHQSPSPRGKVYSATSKSALFQKGWYYYIRGINKVWEEEAIPLVFYPWWGSPYLVSHGMGKELSPGKKELGSVVWKCQISIGRGI